jgi:3-oxoacyl-[acyl-carrier-protein] synthase II
MMDAYLTGIGWVTGGGFGWGSQGGDCGFPELPLPPLSRKDVFPEPNQRFGRMSEYAKLGLAALTFALRDAGLEGWSAKRAIGVVASTRQGCLATDLEYHRTVQLQGGGLASPNLFAYTLANCFLGDAAILFGLTGSLVAINEAEGAGLGGLRMALEELATGEAGTMLAGVCDLPVPELPASEASTGAGAAFLVLTLEPPLERAAYGTVTLTDAGAVLLDGAPCGDLAELIERALAKRAEN